MRRFSKYFVRMFMALLLGSSAAPPALAANLGSDFDILNRKSIFSKDRVPAPREDRQRQDRDQNRRTQRRDYIPVLVGVLLQSDGYVAFICDPATNDMTIVRTGDTLPNGAGVIKDVTLDYIETAPLASSPAATTSSASIDRKPRRRVMVGQNILGGVAEYPDSTGGDASDNGGASNPAGSADTTNGSGGNNAGSSASPAPASGPAPTGNSVADIAERLRRRRQSQLGK